ncbi:MAG: preprotein translocase subunit SecA [Chloroflexi bacterium]|nr:preprotein translocase subunit SecA [Chloroflexota bacterium]
MVSVLSKLIGDSSEKAIKKFRPIAGKINGLEESVQKLSDGELRDKTEEFKTRLSGRETLDDLLPEAFAVVRESARRNLGQRHYDVQLIGGMVLHRGQIAEMKTGEGKTLVATLAVYLNALTGLGVHVVTVNDYLARRDPVWMGPIYHALGLSVASLQHDSAYLFDPEMDETPAPARGGAQGSFKFLRPINRGEAYGADITYGTNNEFGFDYLRDNMALEASQRVQRGLNFAIVDEVDNILIDEARTPLIISGPAEEPVQHYYTFAKLAPRLQIEEDYTIDDRTQAISLTQEGIGKMERWSKVGNLYDPENFHLVHYIENALTANITKLRDKDYVMKDGEIVIVDEFTGRLQPGRRWSDGLHQAVEAKEGLKIQRESITYATITLQNYFRMYGKLSGMTGTAATESDEFMKIYRLDVAVIPTNLPLVRDEAPDLVFQTEEAKWKSATESIAELHEKGQPVLVGTTSIEASEQLSERLKRRGVPHQVLNAKIHEQEAGIVAQAGRLGAVTVSTNMAGRGTDIILGGADVDRADWQEEHDKVIALGGLHVLGTEHHDARRIDNQLRGRAGRQGDPGSSQFFVSLEDELMQRFGGERIKSVMAWTGLDEDVPIENRLVTKSIGGAQVKVEGYHFDMRKHLLDYDDVLNQQREIIYADRHAILDESDLKTKILDMVHHEFDDLMGGHLASRHSDDWDVPSFLSELGSICPLPPELANEDLVYQLSQDEVRRALSDHADRTYALREEELGADQMRTLERLLLLRAIDNHWVSHLTSMENLRTGIGLQAYGQRDPLVAYRSEGRKMFLELLQRMQYDVVHTLFHVAVNQQPSPGAGRRARGSENASPMQATNNQPRDKVPVGAGKIGRNAQCPCGSGKKYKRCHGANG